MVDLTHQEEEQFDAYVHVVGRGRCPRFMPYEESLVQLNIQKWH